jgi:omega-amidase
MDLIISGLQYDIFWEDKDNNISKIENMLKSLPAGTDIILLPEMFTTGFSMNAGKLAETMEGESVQWMKRVSVQFNAIIVGSLIIRENTFFRNRFIWVDPKGNISFYDKRHSFGLAKEHEFYVNGNRREIFTYKEWNFLPSICYDLRFPVWLKNNLNYHVILNVANWPSTRAKHWNTFLVSRAIENQAYMVGINRIGKDGAERNYRGDSTIVDFDGNVLNRLGETEGIISSTISFEKLQNYRNKYPFLKDQDIFSFNF